MVSMSWAECTKFVTTLAPFEKETFPPVWDKSRSPRCS